MNAVAIVGKPNSGKSLLFNRLTGLNQKVTNFPGITVQIKRGQHKNFTVYDFPGIYTFHPITKDESVAIEQFEDALAENNIRVVLCVLDVGRLSSSLRIGLEMQKRASVQGIPIVFALNMMDEVGPKQIVDWQGLQKQLQAPVVPISAKTGSGLNQLVQTLTNPGVVTPVGKEPDFYVLANQLANRFGPQSEEAYLKRNKLDRFLLSPVTGLFSFVAIMALIFQSVFSFSIPLMDFIDWLVGELAHMATHSMADGPIKDFLVDALFGGFGSFLVFVPQIFFLTFLIGILEDSGYLARAALICHRPLKFFGLSGKSFVPILTGHACAIPAIFASRIIESPKRRFLTILIVPLMSCSARLPVYALLIATVIPRSTFMGGFVGLQGIALFLMYLFGIGIALLVSLVLSRSKRIHAEDIPFILEMPQYRIPHWRPLLTRSLNSAWQFVSRAGVTILIVTIVVWLVGYFPNGSGHLDTSYLGYLGHFIEPVLRPLDLDWKYGVAILTSFLAREVFVSTLGTMFGIEDAEANFDSLIEKVQTSGMSFASGMALMVFYAVALQCVSTFVVIKNELGNYKVPLALLLFYSILAYVLALVTYLIFS